MELFFQDNHFIDEAHLNPITQNMKDQLTLVRELYSFVQGWEDACLIGETHINSLNFKVGKHYIKIIEKNGEEKKYVEHFPDIAAILIDKAIPSHSFHFSKNGKLVEMINLDSKTYYTYVLDFSGVQFYTGSKLEFREMLSILEKIKGASASLEKIVSKDKRYQLPDLVEKLIPFFNIVKNKPKKDFFDEFFLDHESVILSALKKYQSIDTNNLKTTVLHCDLHPHNILTHNHKIVAIIDYESFVLMPEKIFEAFAIFKLARKGLSKKILSLAECHELINERGTIPRDYLVYTYVELLRRLSIVLHYRYTLDDERLNQDLLKHVTGLKEADFLFT